MFLFILENAQKFTHKCKKKHIFGHANVLKIIKILILI